MKLGFAVRVLGRAGLKSRDARRWQDGPHLSVSLAYLRDIFVYLRQIDVRMYRLSPDLAPYVTHPELPQFHDQISSCAAELAALGELVQRDGLRLSIHPGAHLVLSAPDPDLILRSTTALQAHASLLDHMGLGAEAVIIVHVGGAYEDKSEAMDRFVERVERLPEHTRRRLALENDDRCYTLGDTYAIHRRTGLRLVYDRLHDQCNPTPQLAPDEALHLALNTWPLDQTPKIHFSSPTTTLNATRYRDGEGTHHHIRAPRLARHADLIDPFAFAAFLGVARGERPFDVMLECRAGDIALIHLRRQLARYFPELVDRYQIS
ncbi:MAG: UV DNA damage repair endonuclease UvsE [Anaerolineae bacterium]|nr:UV DNA damage repair endonuclease UvsE [Anaerolineae bacterium]